MREKKHVRFTADDGALKRLDGGSQMWRCVCMCVCAYMCVVQVCVNWFINKHLIVQVKINQQEGVFESNFERTKDKQKPGCLNAVIITQHSPYAGKS